MKKIALLVSLLVALLTLACGKQEQSKAPEEKKTNETSAVSAPAKVIDKVEQAAAATAEKTAELATAIVAQVEEKTAAAITTAEPVAQAVAEKAAEVAQTPAAAVEHAIETGKERLTGTAAEVVDTAAAVEQKVAEKVEAVTETVVQAVAPAGATMVPESVIFEAANGNITLTHKKHADAFECAACHGEGTPGTVVLGKEKAHTLCKGCHQEKAAGPTKCAGCHVKS